MQLLRQLCSRQQQPQLQTASLAAKLPMAQKCLGQCQQQGMAATMQQSRRGSAG